MSKHTIDDIQGLPEGWEAVAYRCPVNGEYFLPTVGNIVIAGHDYVMRYLIIQKTKPREITLVETDEDNAIDGDHYRVQAFMDAGINIYKQPKIWRIKEE